MKQFLTVFQYELTGYFKNKSYQVTTILFTLVLALGLFIPSLIPIPGISQTKKTAAAEQTENPGTADTAEQAEPVLLVYFNEKNILLDETVLKAAFPFPTSWQAVNSKEELISLVKEQKAEAGFIITSELSYTYVIENNSFSDNKEAAFSEALLKLYRSSYLTEKNYPVEELENLYRTQVTVENEILGKDSVSNYAYTYILLFILYIMILLYGQMIAVSVTTEKSNRTIEVLVTSTSTNSLIFGKVLAGAAASILQIAVILGAGLFSYQINRGSWNYMLDFLFQIPKEVLLTFAIFGIMGYLFYAFLYGALGALVSKTEDISKSSGSLTFLFVIAFMIGIFSMTNSDGILIKVTSFLPFTSCNSMLVRVAMGNVSTFEIIVSFFITGISILFAGMIAAKIYRFGTLMYGNPIKLKTALKKMKE